jgi:hypothetical protein
MLHMKRTRGVCIGPWDEGCVWGAVAGVTIWRTASLLRGDDRVHAPVLEVACLLRQREHAREMSVNARHRVETRCPAKPR